MQRGCWHCENFYRFLFKVLTDDNFNDYFNNEEIFWRWLLTPDGLDSAYRCGIKFREFPRIGRGENYNKSFNSWLCDSYNLLTGLKIGIILRAIRLREAGQARQAACASGGGDEKEIMFENEQAACADEETDKEIVSFGVWVVLAIFAKNSSFRLPYQRPSSSADCARELFNGSNGSASLVDCTRKKNFCLGVRVFCE